MARGAESHAGGRSRRRGDLSHGHCLLGAEPAGVRREGAGKGVRDAFLPAPRGDCPPEVLGHGSCVPGCRRPGVLFCFCITYMWALKIDLFSSDLLPCCQPTALGQSTYRPTVFASGLI